VEVQVAHLKLELEDKERVVILTVEQVLPNLAKILVHGVAVAVADQEQELKMMQTLEHKVMVQVAQVELVAQVQ
jgi:ribosomal protein L24